MLCPAVYATQLNVCQEHAGQYDSQQCHLVLPETPLWVVDLLLLQKHLPRGAATQTVSVNLCVCVYLCEKQDSVLTGLRWSWWWCKTPDQSVQWQMQPGKRQRDKQVELTWTVCFTNSHLRSAAVPPVLHSFHIWRCWSTGARRATVALNLGWQGNHQRPEMVKRRRKKNSRYVCFKFVPR